ncbi:MAG TPA: SDR family oxidoreductase [Acetobacteraceae bacterium]|nr:SDR family oxidoreductase [Acetobacteraceae bacterium]
MSEAKVALITGSAMNIGRGIALALARDGYRIMVTARHSRDACEETARLVAEAGSVAAVHLADISDPVAARELVAAAVARFGRLDVLVNNASVRRQSKLADISVEEWRWILGSTLDGAFWCAQAAAPHIARAGGGSIVNLGGISAHAAPVGRVHVAVAKAGMVGLTRALARELAPESITVNAVAPGAIDTQRGHAAGGNAGLAQLPENLAGRRGTIDEIAEMVRYLCGPHGRFITGQVIHVNGGAFMG